MKKRKVFYVIDSLQTGGAEKSIFEIVSRLPSDIVPVVVVIYENLELKYLFDEVGIQLECFHLQGKYDWQKALKMFNDFCKKERPDLVVATLYRSEIISRIVCHRLGIRHIGTFVNDNYSSYARREWSLQLYLKQSFFWFLNWWTARYCYRFLANSESIKRNNARNLFLDSKKIDVIYRGRNVSHFSFNTEERLRKDNTRFLNVGRLIKRKGQMELVEAFARFQKTFSSATLTIAGEGPLRPTLEKLIKQHGLGKNVFLIGNVSNVPQLLQECDLFVFPSWYEGFSGALIEAMLAGAPILASDIDMNTEAVENNKTGRLFQVQSSKSLLNSMEYAVAHPEDMRQMARNARKEAEEKYNIEKIALQHARLYRQYLDNKVLSEKVAELKK